MTERDPELVSFFIDEATDLLNDWERICLELEKAQSKDHFDALFRIAHNIKGSSRAVGLVEVGDLIHKVEDVIVAVRDQKTAFTSSVLSFLLKAHSFLTSWFTSLLADPNCSLAVEQFDMNIFVDDSARPDSPTEQIISETAPEAPENKTQSNKGTLKDEMLRVSARKIDNLLNLIGELSIQQSILENSMLNGPREQESLIFSSLNLSRKITKEIYDTAFGLRMTPIGGIYQRLERAIKDLARDVNKDIEVDFVGSEVEIEKTILDKLLDPLTHLVRNSVDHGIELKEERLNSGKSPQGKVTIAAQKEGDGVEIIIKDDGKGLNQKRILAKAIEKGLVKNPESLTQEEIFGLIFLPGFSTAEQVTNISGRGVGMDVVMKTVEEVEGRILMASEEGRGTKIKISIPTSLSIVESLIVQVNGASYVLPINSLEEVLETNCASLQRDHSVFVHRGQTIPFLHLSDLFGTKSHPDPSSTISLLVTKVHGKRIALGVDSIVGQHQSVVRALNSYFHESFAISGGTILPSGEPGLILNVNAIVEKFFHYMIRKNEAAA
jgi:two-component system, chemotaxis family, sensor kinase CheA